MFKPIPGHSQYVINEDGSIIKRIDADKPSRLKDNLCKWFTKDKGKEYPMGYWYVKILTKDHINKLGEICQYPILSSVSVHRLVAMAWIGPQPEGMPWVNHEDGSKINNHYTNLKWGSIAYNIRHAHEHGLVKHPSGKDHWIYGKKMKAATRKLMSAAKIGDKHPRYAGKWSTPKGDFNSTRLAAKAMNLSYTTIYYRCKNSEPGYCFIPITIN